MDGSWCLLSDDDNRRQIPAFETYVEVLKVEAELSTVVMAVARHSHAFERDILGRANLPPDEN